MIKLDLIKRFVPLRVTLLNAVRSLAMPLAAALCLCACSCSTGSALQQILGLSAEAPVFLDCKAVSPTEIIFRFSLPVKVTSLHFDPAAAVGSITNGAEVSVVLDAPMTGGERITADILVEDTGGNTLNVLVPFRARNDDMPSLVINEIRTEYSKPKVEFVEMKILSAGNLGGMRMFLAGNAQSDPFYEFPPAKVAAGEYIVIHLRTLDPNSVDETGDNLRLTLLTSDNEAQITARDFWIPGSKKHLSKKAGTVFFLDQDDTVLDAVMFSENPDPWWQDEKYAQAADFLREQGAWLAGDEGIPGPADAVSSKYTTATRSLSRKEGRKDTNTADDWYTTAASCATPGKVNNEKVYVVP
ncbi:hypothetical protein AGMMS49991_09060 [Spirochaetia bacterium]|nr:hypothetical protein AGMMS49991_09060 [Spirochaetia bacterium]